MAFLIRSYHPSDLCALYRICLLTGDNGADASRMYHDPDLIGHYYAAPYAVYEPDVCFIATYNGSPCGYILGTRDTSAFHARCEQDWVPILRERYPLPDAADTLPDAHMVRAIHRGIGIDENAAEYPTHLHIDILPVGQGQHLGQELMQTFLKRLREFDVPALHLGVGKRNPRAVRFYERAGFHIIEENGGGITFGMHL